MSLKDPISDMFVRIKNAQLVKKATVKMPASTFKVNIAKVLLSEGYIQAFTVTKELKKELILTLKYYRGRPVIDTLKRVSLPGCRVYRKAADLPRVRGGLGTSIVSTAQQGVISGRKAYANRLGGEVLGLVA